VKLSTTAMTKVIATTIARSVGFNPFANGGPSLAQLCLTETRATVDRMNSGHFAKGHPSPAGRTFFPWAAQTDLARLYRGRGLAAAIGVSFEVLRVFTSSLWNAVCVVVGRGAEEGGASLDVYDLTVQAPNMPSLDGHNVPSLAEM
jgi:hypothetical protein